MKGKDFCWRLLTSSRFFNLNFKWLTSVHLKRHLERLMMGMKVEFNHCQCQVAFSHPLANRTDGNHIFLNFVPCISIDPVKIGGDIKAIVFKYATRLLKLQV